LLFKKYFDHVAELVNLLVLHVEMMIVFK
jgi:hypothetical protein